MQWLLLIHYYDSLDMIVRTWSVSLTWVCERLPYVTQCRQF